VEKFSIQVDGEYFPMPEEFTSGSFMAGVKASIELQVFRQAAGVWFDTIIDLVNGYAIPDILQKNGNYYKDNVFNIVQRVDQVTLTSDVAQNAIVLNCN